MKSSSPIADPLVVIVNYKTPQLTLDCLHSLAVEQDKLPKMRVVVTTPRGVDDSAAFLQNAIRNANWSHWVQLQLLDHNGGFAYANNQVLRHAMAQEVPPRYVLLLNPDTQVKPGAIQVLMRFLEEHPSVGMVGSRLEDVDGTPQASAFRFPTIISEFVSTMRLGLLSRCLRRWVVAPPIADGPHQTDWLAGASLLIRREVFQEVGLLDDRFFLYYEEVDFCFRARQKGWPCWYEPASRVVHLVGAASGISDTRKAAPRRPAYWFESRRRYFLKHHGKLKTLVADILWMTGFALWRVRRWIQRKPDLDPPRFLADFFQHSILRKGFGL